MQNLLSDLGWFFQGGGESIAGEGGGILETGYSDFGCLPDDSV